MKFSFIAASSNRKTGPMPTVYASRETCPESCPMYRGACYAEGYHTAMQWNRTSRQGLDLDALIAKIEALPRGQIWRYGVAGDLPGQGEAIDAYALGRIVRANRGRKGFSYTHKKTPEALRWVRHAIDWGFAVNISADDAGEADTLAAQGFPVAVVVPIDTPKHTTTPQGRPILVCPAQTREGMTCALCQLCANPDRRAIIGFRAHGTKARQADRIARRVIPIQTA